MKIQGISILVLSTIIMFCHAELTEEMKTRVRKQLDECKTTEGANDADVSGFLAGSISPTLKGKCLISCLQEAFKLTKDGQVQPEGGLKLGQMLFGNSDDVLSVLKKMSVECSSISDTERCEAAFKRMSCARDVAKKYGLSVPQEMI